MNKALGTWYYMTGHPLQGLTSQVCILFPKEHSWTKIMREIWGWVSICGRVLTGYSRGVQSLGGMEAKDTGSRLGTLVNNEK